jgi:hypothetical protein
MNNNDDYILNSPFIVDKRLAIKIQKLNSQNFVSDLELIKLQLSRKDEIKFLNIDRIMKFISIDDNERIKSEFINEDQINYTLRWVVRGLNIELSIRKTFLDITSV